MYLILLTLSPVIFFVQTLIHEGAHCLAGILFGGKILKFQPYPHKNNDGTWVMGSASYTLQNHTSVKEALTYMAPQIVDIMEYILLAVTYPILTVIPLLDTLYNIQAINPENDTAKYSKLLNISKNVPRIIGNSLIVIGILITLVQIL